MSSSYDAIVIGGGTTGWWPRLPGPQRRADGRARVARPPAVRPPPERPGREARHTSLTRLSHVTRPDAAHHHQGPGPGPARYKVYPMGPYFQAFPEGGSLTIYDDDPARTHAANGQVVQEGCRRDGGLGRRAGRPRRGAWGRLLTPVPPTIGSHRPGDLVGNAAGLEPAWARRANGGDVTRLMTMSITDLLGDWFESPQIGGRARFAVNGVIGTSSGPHEPEHRLPCHGAPLDRRRRRRSSRQLGVRGRRQG